MKKNKEKGVIITTIILVLVFFIYFLNLVNFIYLKHLVKIADYPQEFVCANVLVYGSSDSTVSTNITFLSDTGETIYTIERSFNGNNLYVDFVTFSSGKKMISFPTKVYSDYLSSSNGIILKKIIFDKNKCLLYKDEKIHDICKYCYSPNMHFYNSVKHTKINLSQCEFQKNYVMILSNDGSINVLPLDEY